MDVLSVKRFQAKRRMMIYFDNAATTKYKPEEVYKAFEYYVREIGVSPGRGSYQLCIEASRMLYKSRKRVAGFFGLKSANVIFTKNSTEAINLFFKGFLKQEDHVILTCYEHNAVLRPLHKLKEDGFIKYSIISREDLKLDPVKIFEKYANRNTVLFATTLVSNLTGRVVYSPELTSFMGQKGITTFLDSSQGAGKIHISMQEEKIDYLAFTGHKDLMALPGVGGLCCNRKPEWPSLIQGGTGMLGDLYVNPNIFPEGYEAGTLNMPAIWSLNSALEYCERNFNEIQSIENDLTENLIDGLEELGNIVIYDKDFPKVGTVGFNVKGYKSNDVIELLDKNGICARGGMHCAILPHEALETVETGAVRVSLSQFNKKEEIDFLIKVLKECR